MGVLFHKKSTAILTIAAILLVVLLVCALLITLSQMMSLDARAHQLKVLLEDKEKSNADKQAFLDYVKTDDYVSSWALKMGYIQKDDYLYIEKIKGEN